MLSLLKNKNIIIGLVVVLGLGIYFIFGGSKGNSGDFNIGAGVTIGSLDNSSDNSTSVKTDVKNIQEQNQDVLNNITNLSNEEKQNKILEKTLQNNSEIDSLKKLYSNESKLKNLTNGELKK